MRSLIVGTGTGGWIFVRNAGGAYGVSYRWNAAGTAATLVAEAGDDFDLSINVGGTPTVQHWRIPSRAECMTCHSPQAGHALSFRTRQLNAPGQIGLQSGNLMQLMADAGYLENLDASPLSLAKHVMPDNAAYSLEARARAWLDVNCAYCHMDGGTAPANFDARVQVPLFETDTVNILPTSGVLHPDDRLLAPGQEERSVIVHRAAVRNGYTRMPPLASGVIDPAGVQLLKDWIESGLPGRKSYDQWKTSLLGTLPPGEQLPDADADDDGRTNRTEFLEHTQPLVPDGGPVPAASLGDGLFRLHLPELPGRGVRLESSSNLVNWSDFMIDGNDGLERSPGAPWQPEFPATGNRRFFRALIEER